MEDIGARIQQPERRAAVAVMAVIGFPVAAVSLAFANVARHVCASDYERIWRLLAVAAVSASASAAV